MEKKEMLYEGKAKKVYTTEDPDVLIVSYKDDATAFNGLKKGTIVGKGAINNRMTNFIFKKLEEKGVPTHLVEELNDRETAVKKVEIVPLEVIIRNYSAGSFAISVTRGRCNTVRKALLIQKLMEHHALCVIVKKNIIADMFIFFFHFTDSASPQMLRFLYEAVQHLYRCNLFPERVPEYFSPSVLQKLQVFLCRTGSRTSDCSR